MKGAIVGLSRYIVCSRVTLRPIFEFVDPAIHPNDALNVFAFEDDYSFGILQSDIHWQWFVGRCSTQNGRPRYTSDSIFDTFPWPQVPSRAAIKKVAAAAVSLRALRHKLKQDNDLSFRELYRTLDLPGANPLKTAHTRLDEAVREAYGVGKKVETLTFLLDLNARVAQAESKAEKVTGPGLPAGAKTTGLVTSDCLKMP